jgi:hypothetical protein
MKSGWKILIFFAETRFYFDINFSDQKNQGEATTKII